MNRMRAALLAGWMVGLGTLVAGAQEPAAAPMAGMAHTKAAASTSLAVSVAGKTVTMSVADLAGMPQKTVTVHNAHRDVDEVYTGVALTEVLAKAGEGAAGKPLLRSYVRAEGTDRYWVLYSGIEVEAASHLGNVIVATSLGAKPLGESGAFMLVSTEDRKPQRWVRNLAALTLVKVE